MILDKKKQEAQWFADFELSDDQLEALIENKLIRAQAYYNSLQVREQTAEKLE